MNSKINLKASILGGLVLITISLSWAVLKKIFLEGIDFINISLEGRWDLVILAFVLICLSLSLAYFFCLLTLSRLILVLGLFLISVSYLLFWPFHWLSYVAVLLFWGIMVYAAFRIQKEARSRIKFEILPVMNRGLKEILIGMMALISLGFYLSGLQTPAFANPIDRITLSISKLANRLLPLQIKNYKPDMTLDEFLLSTTKGVEDLLPSESKELINKSPELRSYVEQETQRALAEARAEFSKTFKIKVQGDEKMEVVVQKIIHSKLKEYLGPYERFIPTIFAIGVFFVLKMISFLFYLFIKMFSVIIFQILIVFQIAVIKKIPTEKETFTLKA